MTLRNLVVGHIVTIFKNGKAVKITQVDKKTKTLIITQDGHKFNINTGFLSPHEKYNDTIIKLATEEDRKAIKTRILLNKIKRFNFETLDFEQLEAVYKVITDQLTC